MSTRTQRARVKALRYGMTKPRIGAKMVWLSIENKNGWSLGLALNKKTLWLRNTRFATRNEVERALEKSKVVFINLKRS